VAKANRCRAKKENPKDPNSAWIRNDKKITHPMMSANTLSESLSKLANFYGVHTTILGMVFNFIFDKLKNKFFQKKN
jgi:hypothetical protein